MSRKVIITCAVTGAIHTPSMSKALPVTPQEIADAAVDAAEAGAAIVHLHARNPKTGQPDQSPEAFAPFLKIIKQRSNCVINLTTGGAPTMTVVRLITQLERCLMIFRNRSEEHTSELQSLRHLVCRLLLEKKKKATQRHLLRAEIVDRFCWLMHQYENNLQSITVKRGCCNACYMLM